MNSAGKFRIILFSAVVAAILVSGIYVADYQAKPLLDKDITLTKKAEPSVYSEVGEEITYTYTLNYHPQDEEAEELTNIEITDDLVTVTCPKDTLDRGRTMTCTSIYTITEEDMTKGEVTNNASVKAKYRIDNRASCGGGGSIDYYDPSAEASYTINLLPLPLPQPKLSLEKTGIPSIFTAAGQEIKYTYLVENTGETVIEGPVSVTDDMVSVSCPTGIIDIAECIECTASYTTTVEDIAAGVIRNTATASAGEVNSNADSFEVIFEYTPVLSLTKSAEPSSFSNAYQLITYIFTITNTGNVPISPPFTIQDPLLDEFRGCDALGVLQPGGTAQCKGYYKIRDHDKSQKPTLTNCASVSGMYKNQSVISLEACADVYYQPTAPTLMQPPEHEEPVSCDANPDQPDC